MSKHVQCKVQRGNSYMTTWLPKEFAVLGKFLKLTEPDGSKTDGWCVINTYSEADSSVVIERSRDYKKHRSATDI